MSIEDKVEVLRGTCCFLLKELQKTYLYIQRHRNGHDTFLHKDLAQAIDKSEDVITMFFPDFLEADDDPEEQEQEQ